MKEKGKAISVQTETYGLLKSAFKNVPIMWLFAPIFLNANIDNFGLCTLSVSIYLSLIGNFFQRFVGSQLYFSPSSSQVD